MRIRNRFIVESWIRIRIKLKSRIRIHINTRMKGRIWIRIRFKVKSRIWIRRKTEESIPFLLLRSSSLINLGRSKCLGIFLNFHLFKVFVRNPWYFYKGYFLTFRYAFEHCDMRKKNNKRLILIYLVPVKMLLGKSQEKEAVFRILKCVLRIRISGSIIKNHRQIG